MVEPRAPVDRFIMPSNESRIIRSNARRKPHPAACITHSVEIQGSAEGRRSAGRLLARGSEA